MDNEPMVPKFMSLHLLDEITTGFSTKLGGGTYGDVYLGKHKDGEMIAVKVLKDVLSLDDEQFEKEYHNLACLDHKNVVRFVGYCHETKKECMQYNGRMVFAENTKRALCFEYMCNGSLDNFISDESNGNDWSTRFVIIKGICEGLEYLHEKLENPMYHLDLKPANVLLDKNMTAKIADFGLARLFGGDQTQITKSAIGTHGYVPPEYIDASVISIKFDIFSLGVVIIKIMTGRDGYFRTAEMSPQQFAELVHTDWLNRLQATTVHKYSKQVRRCIEIALSCVEADRQKRPSIGVIVDNLKTVDSIIHLLLDASRNGSSSSKDQICPCISNDTEMLDTLKKIFISHPLNLIDNRGDLHEVRITTVGDPAGDHIPTIETVEPKIKIIKFIERLVRMVDAHSTEPWILVHDWSGGISIFNLQNQTKVMAFRDINIWDAKFIEAEQCCVAGDGLGYIHVYSYVKEERLQTFRAHSGHVTSLAVHPSEPFVLSASCDNLIKLWNRDITRKNLWTRETAWQCIQTFNHSEEVYTVRFNPQTPAGNTFASSSLTTIKIWNTDSTTHVATMDCNSVGRTFLDYFAPSGDKQYLVTGRFGSGNVRIWDLQTNTCIKTIEGLQKRQGCAMGVVESLTGRPILLTVSEDNSVAICDSTTHRYENRVRLNLGNIMGFAYVNEIRSLAIVCQQGIGIMEIN